LVVTDF